MRLAVIDLGTNTFNLLVAETKNGKVKYLFNEKESVKLGEGGINSGIIQPEPFERGVIAFEKWVAVARNYRVEKIIALATSAVRGAKNGNQFTAELFKRTGVEVSIIDGEKEAELIFKGVLQACPPGLENVLVMDIGGGSTEFIIGNENGILWKQSFKLGVARLLEKFKPSEPITPAEIESIEHHLHKNLEPLWLALKQFECKTLIGSSGSFDTFADLILQSHYPPRLLGKRKKYTFPMKHFFEIHRKLILKNKQERMAMPGMLAMRVDMIVLASLFCAHVLRNTGIEKMKLSTFSLKEGAFFETIQTK